MTYDKEEKTSQPQHQQHHQQQPDKQQEEQKMLGTNKSKDGSRRGGLCFRFRYILGVYMLNLGGSIAWIWGNLSVYTRSFMYDRIENTTGLTVPWIVPLYYIGWCFALLTRDLICRYINRTCLLILAIAVAGVAIMASCFTLQFSTMVFNITFGLIPGYGSGMLFSLQLVFIVECVDSHLGFFTSGVNSCTLLFGFVTNELITFYVNPKNLEPDDEIGELKIFTEAEILDKVPNVFLYFSIISVICGVVGMLLMIDKKSRNEDAESIVKCEETKFKTSSKYVSILPQYESTLKTDFTYLEETKLEIDHTISNNNEKQSTAIKTEDQQLLVNKDSSNNNFTPKQAIKTSTFFVLFCVAIAGDTTFISLSSYYKTFGLVDIPDDHFMTNVGTSLTIFVGVFTFISGALVDRFGVKDCLVGHLSLLTLVLATYPFTAKISRWLFFFATMFYGCLSYPFYTINSVAVLMIFGNKHYTTILGMTNTAAILVNCILPIICGAIVDSLGFFGLFFYIGSVTLIVCVIVVVFLKRV